MGLHGLTIALAKERLYVLAEADWLAWCRDHDCTLLCLSWQLRQ
jgi:hypothetical protein